MDIGLAKLLRTPLARLLSLLLLLTVDVWVRDEFATSPSVSVYVCGTNINRPSSSISSSFLSLQCWLPVATHGYLWLVLHNPHIDWFLCAVIGWGVVMSPASSLDSLLSSSCLQTLPSCPYFLLNTLVFTRILIRLPHHRPFDCSIDLLPGSCPPPRGTILFVSAPEMADKEEYICDTLATVSFVHPPLRLVLASSLWRRRMEIAARASTIQQGDC